jgi:alkylation response protein AidB-like acyl-CoA dehydrogenase
LRADLWAGFDPKPAPHDALDAAFAELGARWEDPAAHDAFLRLANGLGALDAAAARYRHVLREQATAPGSRGEDDPQARRALAQLAVLVTQLERTTPRDYLRRWGAYYYYAGVVIGVGLFVFGSLFIWHVLRPHP